VLSQGCNAQTDLCLIALMGQSNMEGRGELSELPAGFPANPTKLWNFTNAYKWEPAKEPIDSPEGQVDIVSIGRRGGVGPSLALADAFVSAHPATSVGLIPCARGATMVMLGDADAKVAILASRAGAAARGEHSRRHQDRGKWIRP
jgi:Carbohydrate esterase, sialic acid-specific acetylesterase